MPKSSIRAEKQREVFTRGWEHKQVAENKKKLPDAQAQPYELGKPNADGSGSEVVFGAGPEAV